MESETKQDQARMRAPSADLPPATSPKNSPGQEVSCRGKYHRVGLIVVFALGLGVGLSVATLAWEEKARQRLPETLKPRGSRTQDLPPSSSEPQVAKSVPQQQKAANLSLSASFPAASSQDSPLQPFASELGCSPHERRALAQKGERASSSEWIAMAKCVERRNHGKLGHFALHISKSGGSSLCQTYKDSGCKAGESVNCWTEYLDFGPKWVRRRDVAQVRKGLSWVRPWMIFDEEAAAKRPRMSCASLRAFMLDSGQNLQMNERWMPKEAPCDDFINVVMIREPVKRIASHYQEIYMSCSKWRDLRQKGKPTFGQTPNPCANFFQGPELAGRGTYNLGYLLQAFNIVSDNYNVRSLNPLKGYGAPMGVGAKVQNNAMLKTAIEKLNRFDWIMLVDSDDDAQEDSNDEIIRSGLGLPVGLGRMRVSSHDAGGVSQLTIGAVEKLQDINQADYHLWAEARRLHRLDVISLRMMAKHANATRGDGRAEGRREGEGKSGCCGHACAST